MRTVGRRWLAPIAAALLLLAGPAPATAVAATPGSAAAASVTGPRAPDDAVHAGRAEHGERGGVAERSDDGSTPTAAEAPTGPATVATPSGRHVATAQNPGSRGSRAPPGPATPVLS